MDASPTRAGVSEPFRVAYVRGVTPTKWARIWRDRRRDRALDLMLTDADQVDVLHDGRAQMAFVRLPIDRSGLHVIPLYEEVAVVVVAAAHAIAAFDEVAAAELEGETIHDSTGDIDDLFALIAAGVGVAIVPHSIARLHARRDVIARPVTDAAPTQIALAWLEQTDADASTIDDFIGIVRGRTARSSRGAAAEPTAPAPARNAKRPRQSTPRARKTKPRR
jgi:DNA-binding transcriptional LysR family regulator